MSNNCIIAPRFVTRKWSGGLGWVLALFFGALTILMFWSLPGEPKAWLAAITALVGIICLCITLMGIRLVLSPLDKIIFSADGVEIRLFGIRMGRIPHSRLRSVIGAIREYSSGLRDYQIYTLKLNYETPRGREKTVVIERTGEADEAISTYYSDITVLL